MRLNRFGPALAALVLAGTTPAFADIDAGASRAAFNQAFGRWKAGDVRGARVELLNALKENPGNYDARLLFARVLLKRGDGVAAQTEIERAVKAGLPRDKTHHLIAEALLLQRQPQRALDEASNASIRPQFAAYAARMRARALEGQGKLPAAKAELDRAARIAPGNSDVFLDLARYQAGTRNIADAGRSADRAIALNPNNSEAVLLKGGLVRATQGVAAALPFYDRALAIDSNSIEALLERAATLGELKRTDAAQADLKKVLGLSPGYPIALYMQAVFAARAGKLADAQALLGQTKGMLDTYAPAQSLKAELALQQGNFGVAFDTLNKLVAAQPDNVSARRALAGVQLQRGDPQGALATLKPLDALPNLDAGTLAMLGSAHAQSGDFTVAQGYYERAAKLAPASPQIRTQLAMTRLAQGDAKGAVAGLEQVLKTDPKALQPLTSLTYVELRAQDYAAARATATRIVAAYPNLAVGYHLRGTAALGANDAKHAEADFRVAIAKDAKFLDPQRYLAQLLIATNRAAAGEAQLRAIIANNPGDVRTMLLLADVAGRANKWPERIDWLRRAETADPKQPGTRVALVQTYVAANRPGDALTEASGLARDRPNDPAALQLLGSAQIANKQTAAAIATFQRLQTLVPGTLAPRLLVARAQSLAPGGAADARATLEAAITSAPAGKADQAYIELVQLEAREKRYDAALAVAERLRAATTQKVVADKLIGDLNMEANRPVQALEAYRRVQSKVNNGQVAAMVAAAQVKAGQGGAALAGLQAFRSANPKDLIGGVALADAYIQQKNWRAAIGAYLGMKNTAAAGVPAVLNNLAYAYLQVGDPRAVAAGAKANQLAPGQPTIEDTYGWILVKTGHDPRRGLALLQAATKGLPRDADVHYHLGSAYKANGQNADAARELKAALAFPGLEEPAAAKAALAGVGG